MKEWKRYFSYLGKYKGLYFLILTVTLAASAGIKLLYSYMNKLLFNAVEYADADLFARGVGLCVTVLVLQYFFPYLRYFMIRLVRKIVFGIKLDLFRKLLRLGLQYYEGHHSAEGLKTLNWDANSLKDSYFSHVYWVAGKAVDGVAAMTAMVIYSPILALISTGFSVITVCASVRINGQIKKMDKQIQARLSGLAQHLSDILMGFPVLKMYRGASIVQEHYLQENNRVAEEESVRMERAALLEMLSFLLGLLANFGTILAGAFMVARERLDYGTVMAVVSLQMSVSSMMQRFGSSLATMNSSLVKAGRVFDFLEQEGEETDLEGAWSIPDEQELQEVQKQRNRFIVFKNVDFAYGQQVVLQNFDMEVRDKEKLLLMGESGCGKSTLLKLLLRLYEKDAGEIWIQGKEIGHYSLEELRSMITYIPQESYLFAGTVRENISFGKNAGVDVPEEEVIAAAKLAYADEFIRELPQGYDTVLQAGGKNLSGGQRQRIAIARAFMKNAPIILMDEPSSALDVQSEKMVTLALEQLMQDRVVLMVTHRRTAFEAFDRVVEM